MSALRAAALCAALLTAPHARGAQDEPTAPHERVLLERIDALDRVIVQLALQQAETRARLEKERRALAYMDQSVAAFATTVAARKALVQQRLRARGRLDDAAWLRILLGAQDPTDVVLRRDWLRRVLKHDASLIKSLRDAQAAWQDASAARRGAFDRVQGETAALERQRQALEAERQSRAALLKAKRRAEDSDDALRSTDTASTRFERERGRLPRPTPGRIVTPFGQREDEELGTRVLNKGVEIEAPLGAPVRAVHEGRVVFAGRYDGFGNLVIVSHGGGWHTLYAHLDSATRAANDQVDGGDVLGVVGDTGSLRGPMLYFEVRRGGEAVDPAEFFAAE